ncbi:hypothetical protein PRIPAC_86901 [Pristionchus pacificus]|uniref:Large ribosomal subunit protein uL15 n=1 Tax=Pristionchus pacificus TaxID=54126 RepID=A0A2A6BUM6_PRIPA|nr:hypothetical protein PRIPAC_86901 [Pristionchus pacificus]|eukprot:PDM69605.1 hypothetical protein PRIPAC_44701 [Pristionchus pacificus]
MNLSMEEGSPYLGYLTYLMEEDEEEKKKTRILHEEEKGSVAKRPHDTKDCANLSDAERFRREIAKHLTARDLHCSSRTLNKTSTIEEQACVYAALVLQDDDFERSFFAHSIQTSASMMLKDGYYLTLRQLLVIVKDKFFSHSAEQKIKAAGGTCVLAAKGTITCVDSARKLSFKKCRDQHVYKIISTITGMNAFRIAAFLEGDLVPLATSVANSETPSTVSPSETIPDVELMVVDDLELPEGMVAGNEEFAPLDVSVFIVIPDDWASVYPLGSVPKTICHLLVPAGQDPMEPALRKDTTLAGSPEAMLMQREASA